jgi:hypothetical protein
MAVTKTTSPTPEDALVEGLKELGRVVLIAAVSAAIVAAQAWAGVVTDPFWNTVLTLVLTAVGKAWDRYIHKNPTNNLKGIVPF